METGVEISFKDIESGKTIVMTIKEDPEGEGSLVSFDFGEEGSSSHDGMPTLGLVNIFCESLGIIEGE